MKRFLTAIAVLVMGFAVMAQNATTVEQMQKEWRLTKQKRDYSKEYLNSKIPLASATAEVKGNAAKELPYDRIWFPGEWEEVRAVVVTPYYTYMPDTNLGSGYYAADPLFTGIAEYFRYNRTAGWESMHLYGPYYGVMDTNSTMGRVFFYLMDGIQKGHAEAWVRVEQASDTAKVLRTLTRMNLLHNNVRFIIGPGNAFWYRDCGPICFYYGDQDSVAMMDFEYSPGRALDDSLPSLIRQQMGIPNYINTFEWEGGNCLVDGVGSLFTSDAVYSTNGDIYGQLIWNGRDINSMEYINKTPLSPSRCREALRSLVGQRETHIMPAYEHDGGTGHIDLYADMWEENGFVFSVMPDNYRYWEDYQTGARNIDSLCSYTSFFNRPYYKSTIPFPKNNYGNNFSSEDDYGLNYTRTYSNHTFVNDLILQPCFSTVTNGIPTAEWDRKNIDSLSKAYPGYTIYPVDVRDFDGSGGAIHCVTKQIPADNPVRIIHKSIVGCANAIQDSMPVSAIITNRSGIAHAECIYRIAGSEWQTLNLKANGNRYYGFMPRPQSTFMRDVVNTVPHITITDSIAVIDSTLNADSTAYIVDTTYTFVYDTTYTYDTVPTLVDTVVKVEYYLSATSNNGKTITKPMTAHQAGYFSYYYTGQLDTVALIDSTLYDFDTMPLPATDITFLFDATRTTPDTVEPHLTGIDCPGDNGESLFGQFYPNPSSTQANIDIDLADGGTYRVTIFDNLGRTVHNCTLQTAGKIVFSLRTDRLSPGSYTVLFNNGTHAITRRLIVQ
ncbi:MAG: agmatine deiminase family protein [Bacteroidales bacterium]|nr:agmatine deiminase family protein [Bacteroidales bacterium]